jgi:hypothetical protein
MIKTITVSSIGLPEARIQATKVLKKKDCYERTR